MTAQGYVVGGMVPRLVQIGAALGMVSQGSRKVVGDSAQTLDAAPLASSSMSISGFISLSSSPLMDSPFQLMLGLGTSCSSPGAINVNTPRNEICSIPIIQSVVPDPLVTQCSMEDHSSEDGRVLYDLWIRTVLTDTPLGLSVSYGNGRGRGGGHAGRGRGRRSQMDMAKERALLDCAAGTQLTIHRVLRATDPQSEVS